MKAGRWLRLVGAVAAFALLPSSAHAQKKKPKAQAPAPAAPAAPANGGEIELDQPATPPPGAADQSGAQPAAPGDQAAAGAAPGATAGGICEIDPSACPKPEDIQKAANRPVSAEVYAVEQIYALRRYRLEINPYWGFTLNDQFVSHPGPGLGLNFYITNVLAIGVSGNWYGGLNQDSDFNFENRRAAHLSVPLNEYEWGANLNFTYVPVYGKFAGFNEFIFSYDAYLLGGLGAISTRPIPVIDPDNRTFQYKPNLDVDLGIGLRIFFSRWFAVNLEIRDYIYDERLEATTVNADPTNPAYWYGDDKLTNNVQAQVGLSIFLPFSWEYRLPK